MSQKYTGGFITKSPVAPTSSAASGIWTLDQQQQAQKAGTWPSPPIFIEDLFSTYLYTGNGGTQTITNGIDVSGKGGLVWAKSRSNVIRNSLFDTARGANFQLSSNNTESSADVAPNGITFNSTGFTTGSFVNTNTNAATYVSWTFAKQPKFFDIVTYTGTGSNQNIAHSLGSVPGCIIVKSTSSGSENWKVYHRSLGPPAYQYNLTLNTTAASDFSTSRWASDPTATTFSVATNADVNASGATYVAYLFAHNAGGFPVSGGGSTNGITCGSWTGTGSTFNVDLGYEPQWLMFKRTDDVGDWIIIDNMRGFTTTGADAYLRPNTEGAESNITGGATLNSTGFSWATGAGTTFIYIAIRRGPMKTPTVGTSVFQPIAYTGNGTGQSITTGITGDLTYIKYRTDGGAATFWFDRLRNPKAYLESSSTVAEVTGTQHITAFNQLGFSVGNNGNVNDSGGTFISQTFKRAPGFFDEVCYTGNSTSGATQTHNLGVVPELMIVKGRSVNANWFAYTQTLGATKYLILNDTVSAGTLSSVWNDTAPTSTTFTLGNAGAVNSSGGTYVAYLFATVAGVSKVGTYTGTGALQTVNCGFTSGARFVLIKRTDSTGDWYTYDSARGITSGNDPYLFLNSTAAEVTGTNYVDTDTTGFKVTAAAPAGLNANGGTYIFLAIA